jgi:hypothetical protein
MGLQKRSRQPEVKGSVHAWIGIVCGVISTIGAIFFALVWAAALASQNRQF